MLLVDPAIGKIRGVQAMELYSKNAAVTSAFTSLYSKSGMIQKKCHIEVISSAEVTQYDMAEKRSYAAFFQSTKTLFAGI